MKFLAKLSLTAAALISAQGAFAGDVCARLSNLVINNCGDRAAYSLIKCDIIDITEDGDLVGREVRCDENKDEAPITAPDVGFAATTKVDGFRWDGCNSLDGFYLVIRNVLENGSYQPAGKAVVDLKQHVNDVPFNGFCPE